MPQIDLLMAAELLVVLPLIATMNSTPPQAKAVEPPLAEPTQPLGWTPETDVHAQRILRLERRRLDGSANPRHGDGGHGAS
jgi:hypothetical protein